MRFLGGIRVLAGLLACALVPAALAGTGLAGRWTLVEQRYEGGGHDFAGGFRLRLAFDPGGARGTVTAEPADEPAWSAPWPAWPGPDGPAPLLRVQVRRPADGVIEAEYTVPPAPGDDTRLNVVERCAAETADRLRCEVRVRFRRGEADAGGFTWTRVFAREDAR